MNLYSRLDGATATLLPPRHEFGDQGVKSFDDLIHAITASGTAGVIPSARSMPTDPMVIHRWSKYTTGRYTDQWMLVELSVMLRQYCLHTTASWRHKPQAASER